MRRGTEIGILLGMLRRRRWLVLAGFAVGLALALLLGVGQDRYRSEAQLLIGTPGTGNTDAQSLERNLNSQLSVLRSRALAADVADRLDAGASAEEVLSAVTVEQVAGSDVVQVSAVAAEAETAAALADAYVQVYLRNSAALARERVAPEVERLQTRLADLQTRITATNEQLADAVAPYLADPDGAVPDPRTVAPEAAAQQQLLLNEYDRVLGQSEALQSQQQVQTASSVLQEAAVDDQPLGPDRQRQVGVVVVATLLALLLALVLEVRSGRAADPAEVEQALGRELAGVFGSDRRLRRSPADVLDLDRLPSEEQLTLWLQADRLTPRDAPALVVVTSVARGAGSTTLAIMLAQQLALSGRRTVLVDAAGGPGSVAALLSSPGPGLVDLPDAATRADLQPGLVAAGEALDALRYGDVQRRLGRRTLEAAVALLLQEYDAVVVDAEPGLGSASGLAQDAHAVVLVVDQRQPVETLEAWALALSHLGDRLLAVLNAPSGRAVSRPSAGHLAADGEAVPRGAGAVAAVR